MFGFQFPVFKLNDAKGLFLYDSGNKLLFRLYYLNNIKVMLKYYTFLKKVKKALSVCARSERVNFCTT